MVGTPPSARKSPAVPADPKHHAERFAAEYADRLEHYVEGRMHSLGIPEEQMGASDPDHGVPWQFSSRMSTWAAVLCRKDVFMWIAAY